MLKRLWHQWQFRHVTDHPASRLAKFLLALRSDCYVSPRAHIYYPQRIRLGSYARIYERAVLNFRSAGERGNEPNLFIGRGTKIMPDAKLVPQQGWIRIGDNCTIQYGCLLYGVGGLEIGDDTSIAANTVITPMNHRFTALETPIRLQGETALGVRIGRDVWIGAGVRILDGVHIGDGCVIGAGSVVTHDVAPYTVAAGVPARPISHRAGHELATPRPDGPPAESAL